MFTMPPDIPVIMPEEDPAVAMPVAPLLHIPPVAVELNVVDDPAHIVVEPEKGIELTTVSYNWVISQGVSALFHIPTSSIVPVKYCPLVP